MEHPLRTAYSQVPIEHRVAPCTSLVYPL
jgi:hypothetical protein